MEQLDAGIKRRITIKSSRQTIRWRGATYTGQDRGGGMAQTWWVLGSGILLVFREVGRG